MTQEVLVDSRCLNSALVFPIYTLCTDAVYPLREYEPLEGTVTRGSAADVLLPGNSIHAQAWSLAMGPD